MNGGVTWLDADRATGPYLNSGTSPAVQVRGENTGNVALTNVSLGPTALLRRLPRCPRYYRWPAPSRRGHSATGTWRRGQHTNTATASGRLHRRATATIQTASDTDDANYFGAAPAIDVEKYVSVDGGATWLDAGQPDRPVPEQRDAPQFKFVVTNTGNVA